jgi:hypothetical protein
MRAVAASLLAAAFLVGCGGPSMTAVPGGHPLNACSLQGAESITPRAGYSLVRPGQIVVEYEAWHNETPDSRACGAQSVTGGAAVISIAAVDSGSIPWVATYARTVRLTAPEAAEPELRIYRIEGDQVIEVANLQSMPGQPQFGGTGTIDAAMPVGRYRLEVRSASGELLAEGSFELTD